MNRYIIKPIDVRKILKTKKAFMCFNTEVSNDEIRRRVVTQIIFTDNYTRYYNYTSAHFRLVDDIKKQLSKGILID